MARPHVTSDITNSFTLARDPTSPFRSCTAEVVCGGGVWWDFYKESVARLGFCRGLLACFFVHFGGRGGHNGSHFGWFLGSCGILGRLGRAVCAKTPWCLSPPRSFYRFWVPKGAQGGSKIEPKSRKKLSDNQSKTDAMFYDLWMFFG